MALIVQLVCNPYDNATLNRLEALGLFCGAMTLYFGLWTFAVDDGKNTISEETISEVATVLIFGVNFTWLLVVVVIYFQGYLMKPLRNIFGKKNPPESVEEIEISVNNPIVHGEGGITMTHTKKMNKRVEY